MRFEDGVMYMGDGRTSRQLADETASPVDARTIVQQQYGAELDINTILRRFNVTGSAPLGALEPVYGDFTGIYDFEDAVAKVAKAREDFMRLPPEVREFFRNEPGELIAYARSHSYDDYLKEEGRLVAKPEEKPVSDDAPA